MELNRIEQLVKTVAEKHLGIISSESEVDANIAVKDSGTVSSKDYPLVQKRPDLIKTPTGKKLEEITLDKVINGEISSQDVRISAEVLEMQAAIAEDSGKKQLADNLRRAAEMARIPDEKVLEIYELLRPKRATKQQLLVAAEEIESLYAAKRTAALIRQSAQVYEQRNILK